MRKIKVVDMTIADANIPICPEKPTKGVAPIALYCENSEVCEICGKRNVTCDFCMKDLKRFLIESKRNITYGEKQR